MRTNKLLNGIIAFVLAGALAAGVCCMGFASRGNDGKWFGNFKNISTWHWSDKTDENNSDNPDDKPVVGDTDNNGGALIGGVENNGISLMSARIAPTAYAENGISPQADTAYSLTATIVPDYASNKAVDWSVSWVNANSAFASGKTVTDYVTVTPTSDGALTANVVCKQAFGEQIQIIVTSRDNSNVTAVCLLDYAKRITGVSFTLIGDSGKVGTISSSTTSIKVTDYTDLTLFLNPIYEYSVYTLDSDFTRETDLNYSTGVYTALSNAGLSLKTLSGTVAHSNQSQGRINWSFSCYTFGTMALTDSISSNIENDIVYGENEYPLKRITVILGEC